jgi:mono/diheme cytochrome c family protein
MSPATGIIVLAFALLAGVGDCRADQSQSNRGRALAKTWCAKCHAIEPGQRSGDAEAPSFARIAADPAITRSALRQLIMLPHYEMPPQTLTTSEIDEIITYILSLKR